jgi:hypothetical protein
MDSSDANAPLESFFCPITGDIMDDPVICIVSGNSYEWDALGKYMSERFSTGKALTDPLTQQPFEFKDVVINRMGQRIIQEWRTKMYKDIGSTGNGTSVTTENESGPTSASATAMDDDGDAALEAQLVQWLSDDLCIIRRSARLYAAALVQHGIGSKRRLAAMLKRNRQLLVAELGVDEMDADDIYADLFPSEEAARAAKSTLTSRKEEYLDDASSKAVFGMDKAVFAAMDASRKEEYLDDASFKAVFGMDKAAFAAYPKWKRDGLKKKHGLY